MFGPNPLTEFGSDAHYHHRESQFHRLLADLEEEFAAKFGLQDYDLLFLTGNGTLANEAVIYSLRCRTWIPGAAADFGGRLHRAILAHNHPAVGMKECSCYVSYETSISKYTFRAEDHLVFADMVSAFPYYMPPKNVDIFTTVSSKQLGALPVLGIIGIRKGLDVWREETWSVLSIPTHLRFRAKHETMTTPAIPLYVDLLRAVRQFDRPSFIEKIDRRREMVVQAVGPENVIGEGPVVTMKSCPRTEKLAARFNLYRSKAGPQVFLWSGSDADYERVFRV